MARRIYDSEQVTVTTVPVAHARSDEQTACLIVLSGANVGRVYQLGEIATIGRETNAHIQLLDAGISRSHAMLRRTTEGQYELLDVGSRNGTYANAQLIDGPVLLADGDKVQVGAQTVLKFSFTDALETDYAQKMYDVALRDGLTGLFNRRYFDERLESELAFSKRHAKPLALLMVDLDHFKRINDAFGHPVGDQVLIEFSKLLGQTVRGEDVLIRYGGEEFAIICRNTDAMKASVLAERIRHATAASSHVIDGNPLQITTSIGVVAIPMPSIDDANGMVKAADEALYQAKAKGRNCVITRRA